MSSKTPPPLVCVEWEDAKVIDGGPWVENKNHEYKPHIFYSVGFLVLDVPEGIHITQAWHPDLVGAPDQIPRGMIRSITPLQLILPPPEKAKTRRNRASIPKR